MKPLPACLRAGGAGLFWAGLLALSSASAHESVAPESVPRTLAVAGALAPPPAGAVDLKFSDFFQRPVGPAGLTPSERLLSLQGRRVRLVGYMAAAALPMAGRMVLAPFPVEMGDEDEHLADDLPAQAVFVHLTGAAARQTLPHYPGLLALVGRLELGAAEEPDGHVSAVRLVLDEDASAACLPK